ALETSIAVAAAAAIAAHLALPSVRADWPLIAGLAFGTPPLLWRVARRLAARELGADVLAAASIVISLAMGHLLVATILVLMLSGGEGLERFASSRASSVLDALARRSPKTAHRKRAGALLETPVDEIVVGDRLVVLPHELCPADGVVVEGRGTMDESYLTGEPYDISKAPGSRVLSGSINGDQALTIEATQRARDSRYASIMRVMADAERDRPRLRRLGDRLAAWYAPLTFAVAALAWVLSGDRERFLAVMVVATPCPLLIAIPVAVTGAISLSAKNGIVIKRPAILERINRCRTVILDKTGTLTYGKPALTEILPSGGFTEDEALRL